MALFDGLRGGYKLVSFKDIPLKINDYVIVKGIYKRAQSIFVKRFVATHIIIENVGDLGETDMMSYMNEDHNIIAQVGTYRLIIYPSDSVIVYNMQGVQKVNGKSPDSSGNVQLNATDIKLTTNQQTIQANIIRIDETLDGKVDIKSSGDATQTPTEFSVYGVKTNGLAEDEEALFSGSSNATPRTIVARNADGQISVAEPTANSHAANKEYVDDAVESIVFPTYYMKHVVIKKTSGGNHELSFNYISQTLNAIENITDLRNDMNQFHGRISGNGHLGTRPIFDIELRTNGELAATARENWTSDTTFYTWTDTDFASGGGSTIMVSHQQF